MFALAHITRKAGGRGADAECLKLMKEAVTILEDAGKVVMLMSLHCMYMNPIHDYDDVWYSAIF